MEKGQTWDDFINVDEDAAVSRALSTKLLCGRCSQPYGTSFDDKGDDNEGNNGNGVAPSPP